jgi:NAD+ kinase
MKRIGILYHPQLEKARDLTNELEGLLSTQGVSTWQCSAWDEDEARPQVNGSDLILSIGGDGTILHAARISAPTKVPILGINLGKLGFITELDADRVPSNLISVLEGNAWIEERAMLEAQLEGESFHALNDVVVRSTAVRLIDIEAKIDGEVLTTYRADGLIMATATGSTGYSLAAGGPILYPQSKEFILQPISCHLGLSQALVLPPQSVIDLRVTSSDKAMLSLDGQINLPLSNNQIIKVKLSLYVARFLRIQQPGYFYGSLWKKLRGKRA